MDKGKQFMLDYKNCSIEDFIKAMSQKNEDLKHISSEYLYILYTKFKADAIACGRAGTSYASGLRIDSNKRADLYKEELLRRGIDAESIQEKYLQEAKLQEFER